MHPTNLVHPRHNLLVAVCAVSAGVHGALVPEHLHEGTAAGVGFAVATALLAALAAGLVRRPESGALVAATALVLAGLLAAYVLATTTGLPLLHPERESLEGLALGTKAVEALGLAVAVVSRLPLAQEGARP